MNTKPSLSSCLMQLSCWNSLTWNQKRRTLIGWHTEWKISPWKMLEYFFLSHSVCLHDQLFTLCIWMRCNCHSILHIPLNEKQLISFPIIYTIYKYVEVENRWYFHSPTWTSTASVWSCPLNRVFTIRCFWTQWTTYWDYDGQKSDTKRNERGRRWDML